MRELITYLPIILLALASLVLFLNINWRVNIVALSLQYVGVFWLVLTVWPTGLAAVKLVTGWMAGAIIGSSIPAEEETYYQLSFSSMQEIRFRTVIWLISVIVIWVLIPDIAQWLPVSTAILLGGSTLIVIGLLQISMSSWVFQIIIGLLTVFSGFEIFYSALEKSVLVAGFLALITMGLAFIGAYLLHMQNEEMSL